MLKVLILDKKDWLEPENGNGSGEGSGYSIGFGSGDGNGSGFGNGFGYGNGYQKPHAKLTEQGKQVIQAARERAQAAADQPSKPSSPKRGKRLLGEELALEEAKYLRF